MNVVSRYLRDHREPLELDRLGVAPDPPFVVITPRFALSAHVIVLVLDRAGRPALAAKLPRFGAGGEALAGEAANLRAAAAALGHDGSTPAVLAYDEETTPRMLLQRALRGTPLTGAALRRAGRAACAPVLAWCDQLAAATVRPPAGEAAGLAAATASLRALADDADGADPELRALAERTLHLAADLERADLPVVFEHGDLGHPNVLIDEAGRAAVLDFERARPDGCAGHDVVFFLAYASMSLSRAPSHAAVADAFYGDDPWAMDALRRHLAPLDADADTADAVIALACGRVIADAHADGQVPAPAGRTAAARQRALWHAAVAAARAPALTPGGRGA